jgi:hypothetical protein
MQLILTNESGYLAANISKLGFLSVHPDTRVPLCIQVLLTVEDDDPNSIYNFTSSKIRSAIM